MTTTSTSSPGPPRALDPDVAGARLSATLALHERSARLQAAGRDIVRLGFGQSPFPVPGAMVEALARHAHRKAYLPVRGLPALREAAAGWLSRRTGARFGPDDILVGPGTKLLMDALMRCFDAAEVLLPAPSWVSYAPQAALARRPVRWLPTAARDGWRLDPDVLDAACADTPGRPRLLVLNSPSNPAGTCLEADRLDALARVAARHRLLVLSDEIYAELDHRRARSPSLAARYPEGTVVTDGLSKWCGAGGWRLGVIAVPASLRWLLDAMATVASETWSAVAAPIQHAACLAFDDDPAVVEAVAGARRIVAALGRAATARLGRWGYPLDGGFYVHPDFGAAAERLARRGIATSDALAEHLLERTGIATLPGTAFGQPPTQLALRLALVDFDGAAALADLDRLDDDAWVERHAGRVLDGIERLVDTVETDDPGRRAPDVDVSSGA